MAQAPGPPPLTARSSERRPNSRRSGAGGKPANPLTEAKPTLRERRAARISSQGENIAVLQSAYDRAVGPAWGRMLPGVASAVEQSRCTPRGPADVRQQVSRKQASRLEK